MASKIYHLPFIIFSLALHDIGGCILACDPSSQCRLGAAQAKSDIGVCRTCCKSVWASQQTCKQQSIHWLDLVPRVMPQRTKANQRIPRSNCCFERPQHVLGMFKGRIWPLTLPYFVTIRVKTTPLWVAIVIKRLYYISRLVWQEGDTVLLLSLYVPVLPFKCCNSPRFKLGVLLTSSNNPQQLHWFRNLCFVCFQWDSNNVFANASPISPVHRCDNWFIRCCLVPCRPTFSNCLQATPWP